MLKTLTSSIIGLGVALLLVILIMTLVLVCVRKRYCSHHPVSSPTSPTPQHVVGREEKELGFRCQVYLYSIPSYLL